MEEKMYENENTGMFKLFVGAVGFFLILFVLLSINPIVLVGAGERGVVFNNISGVEDNILGEGWHFRTPFVQSVRTVSIRIQKDDAGAIAGTNDLQTATIQTTVNWHMDPSKVNQIYQNIGDEEAVLDSIVRPRVGEVVKAASAKYSAEELLTLRAELKATIDAQLREDLSKYNVILDDITLNDIDFSEQFNAAIERKATAEQDALAEQNKLKQVEFQAQQRIEQSKAEAEAIRIQTEALSQNQNLIELTKAEALKISAEKGIKIVPDTVFGDGAQYLIGL